MALLGTGSLRYEELWETFIQLVSHFTMGSRYFAERFSNTVIVDFLLALIKLVAGFMSGSVALIADGADAAMDTASDAICGSIGFNRLDIWINSAKYAKFSG